MKARILTTALLMIALTTFAQTSRRSDQERKSTTRTTQNNDNKRTYQKPEVRTENKDTRRTGTVQSGKKDNNVRREGDNYNSNHGRNNNSNNNRDIRGHNTRSDNVKRDYQHNDQHHNKPTTVVVKKEPRHNREYVHIVRPQRKVVVVHNRPGYHPRPIEYRRVHYAYRPPVVRNIVWSVNLYNEFRIFYPEIRVWRYNYGYRIPEISAYDADMYIGDVARVYGKVWEVYYDYDSDNYFLYIGDYYPYHDFSIVMPGREARKFTRRPERYFEGSHVAVVGYITESDNKPEIVIRRASQVDLY